MRMAGFLAALCCAAGLVPPSARAGHEVPYYPSFYPQEIRIEPLDADAAARELSDNRLHAYVGTAPRFAGAVPDHLKSVVSLRSLLVAGVNAQSPRMQAREARCQAVGHAAAALANEPDLVVHPYPVTPYHPDYLGHADRVPEVEPANLAAGAGGSLPTFRAAAADAPSLLAPQVPSHPTDWDVAVEEVPVEGMMRTAGAAFQPWPWAKEGWFQAYRLLRPSVREPGEQQRADKLFGQLTHGEFREWAERLDGERGLLAALTRGCERSVVGYRLRREFYNDDFSNGVENLVVDSQSGFNSPVFVRTVKLKDFPWNGWLRVGIGLGATAAWNPVGGFTDAAGRLVWSTVGDDAFLSIPHNGRWAQNRVEIRADGEQRPSQSMRVPDDALLPAAGTGRLHPVGAGTGAMARITYRVLSSSFHDGSEMDAADLLYPYAFAFRWSAGHGSGAPFDPEIAAATRWMRERLKGVRILRVEETKLPIADLTFTYRSPIVEVYLDTLGEEQESALLAPPWSSVPWHLLALMETAAERGIAAFSRPEAVRRRLPWLDLVRDPAQREAMRALIREFAEAGHRPAALEGLVGADAAKARWQALDRFVETKGHLLVTNGAYRLASWSPAAFVFDVVRDFTYPIGLGTFDLHAYPPRALITGLEHAGDRILIAADVEMAIKQQRSRRLVRQPLKRGALREIFPIEAAARYLVVGDDGKVAAAGNARQDPDGRFAALLPPALAPGRYDLFAAVFLDGNAVDPTLGRLSFRSK